MTARAWLARAADSEGGRLAGIQSVSYGSRVQGEDRGRARFRNKMPDLVVAIIAIVVSLLLATLVAFGRGKNRCAVRPRKAD